MRNRSRRRHARLAAGSSQIPIIVILVLIILGAIALSVHLLTTEGEPPTETGKLHLWCVETKKPYVLNANTLSEDVNRRIFEAGEAIRLTNPDTGRPTLIRMWQCLECKEYFAPEFWKTGKPATGEPACTHCGAKVKGYGR